MPIIKNHFATGFVSVDNSATEIFVSVKSLFGQQGSILARIEQSRTGPFAQISRLRLGTNAELAGEMLRISASVLDINTTTDSSGLEITFEGIPVQDEQSLTLEWVIKPSGGHVDYLVDLFFSKQ